jgi:uncharacterized protein YaiE (UPF0345 family)
VQFKPSGTTACLKDFTDFPAGTSIKVPTTSDFHIGDPVRFTEEGTGNLDSALATATTYYVVAVGTGTIDVSATKGGAAITLNGDGGTGTADTAGAANHIGVSYAEFEAACSVREWSLDLSRETLDSTTLPCAVGSGSKYAEFRTQVGGYASGEGSLSVLFTADQTSLANRLMANAMLKNSTANVKLYVNAVSGGATIDDSASSYFEGEIALLGFSVSVTPDDVITAEINFSLSAQPKAIFGVTL